MSKTSEQIKQMNGQIQKIGAIIDEQITVINAQSHAIEQNKAALETIINWVGAELGEEAVERLGALMGWTKPDAANEVQCQHGKAMNDYCIECGRIHGGA